MGMYFLHLPQQHSCHDVQKFVAVRWEEPGPRLNIKTVLSRYGDSYVKDKTAVRTSYL